MTGTQMTSTTIINKTKKGRTRGQETAIKSAEIQFIFGTKIK